MSDYIRIVSLRKSSPCKALPGEKVFPIHRGNKVLGNPFVMKDFSQQERKRVVDEYKKTLYKDLAQRGPIFDALSDIAYYHIQTGHKIALECWCAPDSCHGDLMIPVIEKMVEDFYNLDNMKFD